MNILVSRFVYATGEDFKGDGAPSEGITARVDELAVELLRIGSALA